MIFFYSFKDYTLKNCICYIKNLKSKISKLNYDLYVQKSFILYHIKFLITRECIINKLYNEMFCNVHVMRVFTKIVFVKKNIRNKSRRPFETILGKFLMIFSKRRDQSMHVPMQHMKSNCNWTMKRLHC